MHSNRESRFRDPDFDPETSFPTSETSFRIPFWTPSRTRFRPQKPQFPRLYFLKNPKKWVFLNSRTLFFSRNDENTCYPQVFTFFRFFRGFRPRNPVFDPETRFSTPNPDFDPETSFPTSETSFPTSETSFPTSETSFRTSFLSKTCLENLEKSVRNHSKPENLPPKPRFEPKF
jgi:hypothetical protein